MASKNLPDRQTLIERRVMKPAAPHVPTPPGKRAPPVRRPAKPAKRR